MLGRHDRTCSCETEGPIISFSECGIVNGYVG